MSNKAVQFLQDVKDLVGLALWLVLLQSPIILIILLVRELT